MEVVQGLQVIVVLSVLVAVVLLLGRNEVVKRRLACPHKHRTAHLDVVQRYEDPHAPVRVKRCDLLDDPRKIDCDQACLSRLA